MEQETAHDIVVRMKGISKRFGSVQALNKVDIELRRGEVLGLVGDNAAGKSTLMKILVGALVPDEGQIFSDIIVVGADDEPEMLEAIRNGTVAFSFSQQPFGQGYLMVYLPYLMAEKNLKPTARFLEMGLTMIDKDNIDTYKADVDANWVKIKEYVDTELMKP